MHIQISGGTPNTLVPMHVCNMSNTRVTAIFIIRTLFLVFLEVTSPKTSSKVIPQNNSSNNFLSAVFLMKFGKTMALKKLFEEIFDICRATCPFWYYTKNSLFPQFSLLLSFLKS